MMELLEILDGLRSDDPDMRLWAQREMSPPAAVHLLTEVTRSPVPQAAQGLATADGTLLLSALLALALVILTIGAPAHLAYPGLRWAMACALITAELLVIGPFRRRQRAIGNAELALAKSRHAQRLQTARELLEDLDDIRFVGPLAMECGIDPVDRVTDNGIPASAAPPLARLLPRLDATNLAAAGLDRARLYRLLTGMNAMSQPDVLKAILDLAVRLRDPDAYPYVKMFAMEAVAHHNSYRVREAARDVLPLLQDAMQKQRIGSKLLRAAGGPGGDQLLRAAHGATAAGGAELLRASDEAS